MGLELELTVTISYEGAKGRIATMEDAVPVIRQDLTALGIPHPKRANMSLVYPGTVRFFWIALPDSVIHRNLKDGIRPRYNLEEHYDLLRRLSIRSMDLRESLVNLDPQPPHNKPAVAWKPDVGLYAIPMSGTRSEYNQTQPSTHSWGGDTTSESLASRLMYGNSQPPQQPQGHSFRIKPEPVADAIPPPVPRTPQYWEEDMRKPPDSTRNQFPRTHDEDVHMQPDTPSLRKPLNRNRYKSIPDFSPHDPPEVQSLRRELRDVRRQLNANITQERVIIENLRDLGAEVELDASEIDFVTKARIEQFEADLQAERARRRKLEDFVEDIRRECRAPFVVPSLLDAFIEISKMTSEALEEG